MIKIQRASEVEADFFSPRNFEATSDVVRQILADVASRGDEALREYGAKFDAAVPAIFEISHEDLKACAEKLRQENPKLYDAICYSHDLVLRFAKKQCECFTDFEIELESGLFTGQKNIARDESWQCRGESAKKITDYAVAKQKELTAGIEEKSA